MPDPIASEGRNGVAFSSGPPAVPETELPALPPLVAEAVVGWPAEQVWVRARSEVWRVEHPEGVRYLKGTEPDWSGRVEVLDEADRLSWLADRSPGIEVPTVLAVEAAPSPDTAASDSRSWLVTGAVAGIPSFEPWLAHPSPRPLVEALGSGLRRLHDSLDPEDCPFAFEVDDLLQSASRRVDAGAVDPAGMSATYSRHTPERLLQHLIETRPAPSRADLVVAHGDPTQPNLLVEALSPDSIRLAATVDLARLGVSDRYRDLAIVTRSLLMNLGPEVVFTFFDAYGLPNPDLAKLEWFTLVDDMW